MEYGRISNLQLTQLMYTAIASTAILTGPNLMVIEAKNDLWLSPIWGAIGGCIVLLVVYQLSLRYPQLTFIQYLEQIIGNVPGKILGCGYLFFLLQYSGTIVRVYTDFTAIFLTYTPKTVINLTLVMVSAMAIAAGLETMARSVQFFFPIITIAFLITLLLIIKELDPHKILPILADGLMPSLRGAYSPLSWFSEVFLCAFFFPYLKNARNGLWAGLWAIFLSLFSMIAVCLATIMLLGNYLNNTLYPFMDVANYISIADFFENLESAVMAIWVLGVFSKLSVFYYALTLGTTQLLGLSSMRPVVLPIGLLISLFAFWGVPNASTEYELVKGTIPGFILLFTLVIPIFLLLIAWFRKRTEHTESKGVDSK